MSKVFDGSPFQKQFNAQIKLLDENEMTLDHCISDDQPDRVGDTINQDGWDTKNYMMNPVVLDNHDYHKPPIGKCLKIYKTGNQTRAVTKFAPTDEGKKYFELFKGGFMSAFSVGFIPKEYQPNKSGGYHMDKSELLEYSVVTVPCNPRALKSYLADNNLLEEDKKVNEEKIKALISEAVDSKVKELNEKHEADIKVKDEKIADLERQISEKGTEVEGLKKQLEDASVVKSGATLSKGTIDFLNKVCNDHMAATKSLQDFVGKCTTKDEPGAGGAGDGDGDEKEYTDEQIQKLVEDNIKKILEGGTK